MTIISVILLFFIFRLVCKDFVSVYYLIDVI